MTLHTEAVRLLTHWTAPTTAQDTLRQAYLEHLQAQPDGVWRHGGPAHLTASCFVLDAALERVLLTLHRKGRFWVQPGGHCEPRDGDLHAAAAREATEETGLTDLVVLPDPVDLHRHELSSAFGTCREHLDVAFVALAEPDAVPAVSPESEDVAWFGVDDLPQGVVADLPGRLTDAVVAARRHLLVTGRL